jgi:hypothetical protein
VTTFRVRTLRTSPLIMLALSSGLLAACSGDTSSTAPDTNSPAVLSSNAGNGATQATIRINWQPNTDPVAGYVVYYGPTPDTATTTAAELPVTNTAFNAVAPSVSFNAGQDLGLRDGQSVCFRLRAYNSSNTLSDWSAPACGVI